MHYAVLRLELRVRDSRTLKEKRAVLLHLKERLRHRFHLSVQEVDYQDLHQRAALGVALVAHSASAGRDALLAVRREVESDPRIVLLDTKSRVDRLTADDPSDWATLPEPRGSDPRSSDRGSSAEADNEDEDDWSLPGFDSIEEPGESEDDR